MTDWTMEDLSSEPTDALLPGSAVRATRALVYLLIAGLAAAVAWAAVTSIDVVVRAPGSLVVRGEPVRIGAARSGLVAEVAVGVGDRVQAGDLLLRLDDVEIQSECQRLEAEMAVLKARAVGYREQAESIALLRKAVVAQKSAAAKARALLEKELERQRVLHEDGLLSEAGFQKTQRQWWDATVRIGGLEANREQRTEERRRALQQARETDAESAVLAIQLERQRQRSAQSRIVAPRNGTVSALHVLHPGRVVAPSESLVTLVPDGQPLMAQVFVPNESIRRLRVELDARVTVAAFRIERGGVLDARVARVDPDADESGSYRAWIALEAEGSGIAARLRAGMQVEVRVVVARQTVLMYLLRPLRQLGGVMEVSE